RSSSHASPPGRFQYGPEPETNNAATFFMRLFSCPRHTVSISRGHTTPLHYLSRNTSPTSHPKPSPAHPASTAPHPKSSTCVTPSLRRALYRCRRTQARTDRECSSRFDTRTTANLLRGSMPSQSTTPPPSSRLH